MQKNKPWAVLKITRRQYETARLWKKTKLGRKEFDELICSLPEGFIDHVMLEHDADKLVATLFKEDESP